MRTIAFFVYLSFLLFGCKEYSYASIHQGKNSYSSFQNFSQKKHIKSINEDHCIILIEDTDVDLEDECFTGTCTKGGNANIFFIGKYNLLNTLYSSHSLKFTLNYCDNRFKILPYLSGNIRPVYITQRVLRI